MNLQEWRQRGQTVTLPSGLTVRYVQVTLLDLAMRGDIPAPLAGTVNQLIGGEEIELGIEDFTKMSPLINDLVAMALREPLVAAEPDDEHLAVNELPVMDRLYLFNILNEARDLEPFRPPDAEPVDPAQSGDDLRAIAEWDIGDGTRDLDSVST